MKSFEQNFKKRHFFKNEQTLLNKRFYNRLVRQTRWKINDNFENEHIKYLLNDEKKLNEMAWPMNDRNGSFTNDKQTKWVIYERNGKNEDTQR